MTDQELAEIKARYAAIKDAQWEVELMEDDGCHPRDRWFLVTPGEHTYIDGLEDHERLFIEHAPSDIGRLLEYIEQLESKVADLTMSVGSTPMGYSEE